MAGLVKSNACSANFIAKSSCSPRDRDRIVYGTIFTQHPDHNGPNFGHFRVLGGQRAQKVAIFTTKGKSLREFTPLFIY